MDEFWLIVVWSLVALFTMFMVVGIDNILMKKKDKK